MTEQHEKRPIEKSVRYATTVDSLAEAWAVVMRYVDEVGGPPKITISPYTSFCLGSLLDGEREHEDEVQRFEVSVSGMVEIDEVSESLLS